jgi:hypothetical protein
MKIYVTFDYELYFGENTGTVEKCILAPTRELIRIAETHDVRFVFFVDCGFILKLDEYRKKYPVLDKDYKALTEQIKYLSDIGHDMQLHIHPHWEDSSFDGDRWRIDVSRYKLADFSDEDAGEIVRRYKKVLYEITGKRIFAFRAGGWCLQPFNKFERPFRENGITLDSSVFRNGHFSSQQYSYDFRDAPDKDIYRFENDPLVESTSGYFTEIPISPIRNSPLFFWTLFFLGRKDPYLHKPLGDGRAMAAPGYRKKLLTRFSNNPVSVDGFNSSLLPMALKLLQKQGKENMVIIGHPKALSRYSLIALEGFVKKYKNEHQFTTFSEQFPQ